MLPSRSVDNLIRRGAPNIPAIARQVAARTYFSRMFGRLFLLATSTGSHGNPFKRVLPLLTSRRRRAARLSCAFFDMKSHHLRARSIGWVANKVHLRRASKPRLLIVGTLTHQDMQEWRVGRCRPGRYLAFRHTRKLVCPAPINEIVSHLLTVNSPQNSQCHFWLCFKLV